MEPSAQLPIPLSIPFFDFYQALYSQEDDNPTVVGKVLCYLPKVKDEDPELLEQDVKHEESSNQHRTDGEQVSGTGRLSQEFCLFPHLICLSFSLECTIPCAR